jgi:hypothetical protein
MPRKKKNKMDPYDLCNAINFALVYFIEEDNEVKKDLSRGVIVRMLDQLLGLDRELYQMYLNETEEQLSSMWTSFLYPYAWIMVERLKEEEADEVEV